MQHHIKWTSRAGLALLAGVAVGVVAAPAEAAAPKGVVYGSKSVVTYTADQGRANSVDITRSGRTVTVDGTIAIRAGSGCSAVSGDSTKVRCTLKVDPTWARVVLGGYNDTLVNKSDLTLSVDAGAGNDRITGGPGGDLIFGNSGNDAVWGLGGNDHISDPDGANALSGGDGDDLLISGWGNDRLYGGNGDDELNGFLGNDIEDGGPGNDRFSENLDPTESDADSFIGGPGIDAVAYDSRDKPVTADADAVKGDDGAAGEHDTIGQSVESIMGGAGNDRLLGTPRADNLYGNGGADVLAGSTGNDLLIGGAGRDYVNGAGGNDECEQGTGDTVLNCELTHS